MENAFLWTDSKEEEEEMPVCWVKITGHTLSTCLRLVLSVSHIIDGKPRSLKFSTHRYSNYIIISTWTWT